MCRLFAGSFALCIKCAGCLPVVLPDILLVFAMSRFLSGLGGIGAFLMCLCLVLEYSSPCRRFAVGVLLQVECVCENRNHPGGQFIKTISKVPSRIYSRHIGGDSQSKSLCVLETPNARSVFKLLLNMYYAEQLRPQSNVSV